MSKEAFHYAGSDSRPNKTLDYRCLRSTESMKIGVGLAFFKKQFDLPTQTVQNKYNLGSKLRAVKIRH